MDASNSSLTGETERSVRDVARQEPDDANVEPTQAGSSSRSLQRFKFASFDAAAKQGPSSDLTKRSRTVEIEIGCATLSKQQGDRLEAGSVIRLDKTEDDCVDVWVDGILTARGELLVVDGKFAVRVTERIEAANR